MPNPISVPTCELAEEIGIYSRAGNVLFICIFYETLNIVRNRVPVIKFSGVI